MKKALLSLMCFLLLASGCAMQGRSAQNKKIIADVTKLNIEVRETPRGVEIHVPDTLLFDFDSDQLKAESQAKMQELARIFNQQGVNSRRLAVEGHADAVGSPEYNRMLSERRAESVARALVFSGVDKERMAVKGFGMSSPIAANTFQDGSDNPEGRARNRRVELIVEN